jgi:hypothetical protein
MVIKPAAVIASREAAWRSMGRSGCDVVWIATSPPAPRNDVCADDSRRRVGPTAVIASEARRSMRRGGCDVVWIAASPSAPRNDGERYSNFGREQ